MLTVLRLTRWELFKVRKRWMPWILLVAALLVVQATLWGFYAAYGNVGNEYNDGYSGVPDAGGIVTISCAEILDETADAKVGMVIGEMREDARKRVEQRRERGNCPDIVEQIAEDRERRTGSVTGSSSSFRAVSPTVSGSPITSASSSSWSWGRPRWGSSTAGAPCERR